MSIIRVNIIEGLGDPDVVQIPTGVSGQYVQEAFNGSYGADLKSSDLITKSPWVDARAYGTLGTQAVIAAALADIGSDERTLYLAPGTWSITSDLATLANINLKMERGAVLTIATGVTVTINGSLDAGLYQIFSCTGTGKVVYAGLKYPEWWGAKNDSGTTDCTEATAAAVLNGGVTEFLAPNGGWYKLTAAVPVSVAGTRINGNLTGYIKQTTAATSAFGVSASDVKFNRIKIVGIDVACTNQYYNAVAAIDAAGVEATTLSDIEVSGCEITNYEAGVRLTWSSGKVINTKISTAAHGIVGGSLLSADQNDTGALEYKFLDNSITCSLGTVDISRPIAIPYFTGSALIQGNILRGGGMSIEQTLDAATANKDRVRVIGNDCDTGMSVTNGGIISSNTIDLSKAPAGRGAHSTWHQAIEAGFGSAVIGNTIRNHTNGVSIMPGQRVIGNTFESCGDQGGAAGVGMGYLVGSDDQGALFTATTYFGTVIADNVFRGTKGSVVEIGLNLNGSYELIGITVSGNHSYDAEYYFLWASRIVKSRVTGNIVVDAQSACADDAVDSYVMRDGNGCTITYEGNVISNSSAHKGGYLGLVVGPGAIVGLNNFVGMRSAPFYDLAFLLVESQRNDGAWYPLKSGDTTSRPAQACIPIGYKYYDTTISKQIYWNGSVWKTGDGAAP
ncbi:MAG: hypothetical protein WC503_02780 [Candidatus Shapirobacteria bacterium]